MSLSQEKKDQFIGEAQFLRGLIYFNLVRLFGDIPLVMIPTTTLEGLEVTRAPVNTVYDTILKDCNEYNQCQKNRSYLDHIFDGNLLLNNLRSICYIH